MVKYKLLALDLDGTLLNDRQEISEENKKWILKASEAGVTVIASTGRGFPTALPIVEQLGLQTPMITVNGGEIWTKPNSIHRRIPMDTEKIMKLHMLAERHPVAWFWAYATDGIYNKEKWVDDTYSRTWLKFGYYDEDASVIAKLWEELLTWEGLELSNSSPFNIEVNPAGVSKAAAIEEVCRMIGCDISEAVAVGDSLNDLAAIRAAGLGVAMGNAQDAVKAEADVVTGTNNEHGVAQAIQNYILKA
ncbi:Cof-type HAD-IIB family hydrolase [Cohnella ginsengisoli]|uniref:Cof-type HAD-IIB family hydrolase n=1 Tax=Cohnella ginsengisoli TaxID=425004 RepID=A0A9X4KEP1_9BACL|nr:HAD family hydrolase [Cohnella ginsengisoli]MDG0790692.1 Cof-type HAD-IIB family hydrolase [Cohnella ginsengisoli]